MTKGDMATTREQVVLAAREWLGTPWHHQGRVKGVGVDCVGLVIGVARDLGLSAFDVTGYARRPLESDLLNGCHAHMQPVPLAFPGDAMLFRIDGQAQHLGIITDIGLLHAYAPMRRVVEHRLDEAWAARIVAAFRLPGVGSSSEAVTGRRE